MAYLWQVVFKEMVLGSIRYYSTLIRETMNTKADEDGVHEVMRISEEEEADGGASGGGKAVNEEGWDCTSC